MFIMSFAKHHNNNGVEFLGPELQRSLNLKFKNAFTNFKKIWKKIHMYLIIMMYPTNMRILNLKYF